MSAVANLVLPAIQVKDILYATDFSEASRAALPIVSAIARKYGSHVFVAHIRTAAPCFMASPEVLSVLQARDERNTREALQNFVRTREFEGLSVTPILKNGNAARELRRLVHQHHIDLAVMSTHGRTGFRRLLMGSVAEELFRSLSCPVLIVGPNISKRFDTQSDVKDILFPTDLSPESGAVFPYLAAVAAEYEARIVLLHVVPREDRRHPAAKDEAESLRSAMHCMFCPQTDPGYKVNFLVDVGDPTERILANMHSGKIDLIGFGVRKARKISTHLHNTVAYKAVLEAECPVLIAHFGSPRR